MKKQNICGILLSVSMATLTMMGPVHAKQPKQLVCHIDDYGEIAPKMLPAKAAGAHTAHGDPDPQTFYLDADEDGYQSDAEDSSFYGCSAPDDRYHTIIVVDELDCDDGDSVINPGATEVAGNEVDENCDGFADPDIIYEIGDEGPGGGIVFHVTNGGLTGLEAALVDQASSKWCSSSSDIIGVDNINNTAIPTPDNNSGELNTPLIVAICGIDSAAYVAATYEWPRGQTDGFLPNKEELALLYAQRDVVGGFVTVGLGRTTLYQASSEHRNTIYAWLIAFNTGHVSFGGKHITLKTRTVRAF